MAQNYLGAAWFALSLFTWSPIGLAFQSSDARVSIVPRHGPQAVPIGLPQALLRIDSSLALIPVHVTTPLGASVTSLDKENFQLVEDGVEQTITHFAQDDAPISIGLLFDISGSMRNKMRKSLEAAATLLKTANQEDEFFLVEFSERPKLMVPFTPDSNKIYQQIAHTKPFGRTALLDAIHLALVQMKNARNFRKAIVILSDGGDNRSRHTSSQIRSAMIESDVQVYAMGIFDPDESHRRTPEEQDGPRLLDELAQQSGGRLYPVDNLNNLVSISARIGNELRSQYLLGYSPTNVSRDGKYRRVKLNLVAPAGMSNLRTYYRHGYYAPAR